MSLKSRYQASVDRKLDAMESGERPVSTSLRTSQHILHLLLTVLTGGLWAPVWIIRAVRGNKLYLQGNESHPALPSSVRQTDSYR